MAARILIASDNSAFQQLVVRALTIEAYEVIVAHEGNEAIEIAVREPPDLIILAIMADHVAGIDVCRAMRAHPSIAPLPIIMLSERDEVEDKVRGLLAGADTYVTNPIDMREMVARIDALLARNRVLRASSVRKSAEILTFIGAKGGVGATTVALNAAAILAQRGKTVIAAEFRTDNGTFAAQLNDAPNTNLVDLLSLEAAAITEAVVASSLYPMDFGVHILFGPQAVDQFRPLESAYAGAILDRLVHLADYVILDLPAIVTPAHEVVVQNSNHIFVLIEPELSCIASAKIRLAQLATWRASGDRVHLVVVSRQGAMLISIGEIERRLGKLVDGVIPSASEVLGIAVQYGMPLVLYQPQHVMSANLADTLARTTEKPGPPPQSR